MNRILLLICTLSCSLAGVAQTSEQSANTPRPDDYAWGFPIDTGETASFYSVKLPLEFYRSVTDPALRDAGVFNAGGVPVSRMFERAGDEEAMERTSPLPALPLFEKAGTQGNEARLALEREGDSTQFRLDLEDLLAPEEGERLVAYIVDARQSDDAVAALELVWGDVDPGFMGRVTIDGGNDLQNWRNTGSAVIAHLQEDDASIEQRRIALRQGDFGFLRIRWEGLPEGWHLSQVLAVHREGPAGADRQFITLESTGVDADDGGKLFELGGAPAVDSLRVVLPEPNTVISARVMYWSGRRDRWLDAGSGSYHHIIRNGNAVLSEPIRIGNIRTSRFKIFITRGPADADVRLEVGWRPDRLLFLAQGQPPFTLAAGNADDALRDYPQQRIYSDPSLAALAGRNGGVVEASLGQRFELGGPHRMVATREINWQTVLLWLGLILGVVFVGFMAVKTVRELQSGSDLGK